MHALAMAFGIDTRQVWGKMACSDPWQDLVGKTNISFCRLTKGCVFISTPNFGIRWNPRFPSTSYIIIIIYILYYIDIRNIICVWIYSDDIHIFIYVTHEWSLRMLRPTFIRQGSRGSMGARCAPICTPMPCSLAGQGVSWSVDLQHLVQLDIFRHPHQTTCRRLAVSFWLNRGCVIMCYYKYEEIAVGSTSV